MSMATGSSRVGLPENGLRLLRARAAALIDRRWDVHERGQGKVPEQGPVILASNHIGWLDGPLLVAKAPRPAHALVKEEMFAGRLGRLLRFTGQISVSRTRTDSGALRQAATALAAGQVVVIYPEGRRGGGEFERFKGGVSWLALVSGAPVIPVAIFGTRQPGEPPEAKPARGARIDIVYGNQIQLPMQGWPRDRAMLQDAGELILAHLRAHVMWSKNALKRDLPGPLPRGSSDG